MIVMEFVIVPRAAHRGVSAFGTAQKVLGSENFFWYSSKSCRIRELFVYNLYWATLLFRVAGFCSTPSTDLAWLAIVTVRAMVRVLVIVVVIVIVIAKPRIPSRGATS